MELVSAASVVMGVKQVTITWSSALHVMLPSLAGEEQIGLYSAMTHGASIVAQCRALRLQAELLRTC